MNLQLLAVIVSRGNIQYYVVQKLKTREIFCVPYEDSMQLFNRMNLNYIDVDGVRHFVTPGSDIMEVGLKNPLAITPKQGKKILKEFSLMKL